MGVLISGYIPGKKYDKEKRQDLTLSQKDTEYRIIKERNRDKIYEKDAEAKCVNENKNFKKTLTNPHVLLFKYDGKKYLNKKRNPEELFSDNILCLK